MNTYCVELQIVSIFSTFLLAMIQYPLVQIKIQGEMDQVLGKYQMPSFDDEDTLPYLMATVKEIMRWEVAAPLAVPHLLEREDTYRGYSLPKGAIIVPNSWLVSSNFPSLKTHIILFDLRKGNSS